VRLKTVGLIIKENVTGEGDRVVSVLTRDHGLLRAFARGAKNLKSGTGSATGLLCYSEMTIFKGRELYIIDEARPLEVFFKLRGDIERLALGQYFCELAGELSPEHEGAGEHLRLMLNSLSLLASGKKPQALLKAVTELRLLCLSGYMPELTGCKGCGKYEDDAMRFDPLNGKICCPSCGGAGLELSPGLLTAMRFICYVEPERLYGFTLPEKSLIYLSRVTEDYLRGQVQRTFKTLEFYNQLIVNA